MNTRKWLFEWEDLPWFPSFLRECMTDYLQFIFTHTNFYAPITNLLTGALLQTGSHTIIDLCSGAGGPIEQVSKNMQLAAVPDVSIILTDKFPNIPAFKLVAARSGGRISFVEDAVDATAFPLYLKGFRTMFSAFHHFGPVEATAILKSAGDAKEGIAIFDGGSKNIFIVLLISLIHPLAFFFLTPFFRPFKLSRIVFTYIIPLIPLCTIWDGIVSISRLNTTRQLLHLANDAGIKNYTWQSGRCRNHYGFMIAYLIGIPNKE